MKKNFIQLYLCLLSVTFFLPSELAAAESDLQGQKQQEKNNFIRLGIELEYSDNIYKSANNPQGSRHFQGDVEVGYKRIRDTNSVSLDYKGEYQNESQNELDNSRFWSGRAIVSQQIFSKNFVFGASHERQRFIVDQSKPSLSSNETDRDIFKVEQYGYIPYSERSRLILHAAHSNAKFDDFKSKNSVSNIGDLGWQHKFNKKFNLKLLYSINQNEFESDSNSYTQHNLIAQLSGQYQLGQYILAVGESLIKYQEDEHDGFNYRIAINALIKQHFFTLSGSRGLTDSSFRDGSDNELDFFQNQLLWSTQVLLSHQYAMIDNRLVSASSIYFNSDESISLQNREQTTRSKGVNTELNWSIDEQWNLLLFANFKYSELYSGEDKKLIETMLSGRFNMTQSAYLQLSVSWANEKLVESNVGYIERNYATRFVYTY